MSDLYPREHVELSDWYASAVKPKLQQDSSKVDHSSWRDQGTFDQGLGYSGQDRFVLFYFEPGSKEVRWRDTRASGSGIVGRPHDIIRIQEHARGCGVSLGDFLERGDHVLLVDRVCQEARFAFREEAQEFLARRQSA